MDNNSSVSSSPQQPNTGMKSLSKLLPIAIAIILTNGLVFVMFYRRKTLRTSSNYLLFGLAICDFLTGVINIPYFIIFSFEVVPPTIAKHFRYWMYILHTLMAVSAGYHILIINAEKYLAIIKPLRHHLITKKTTFKILAGIWMISALVAIIPIAWENSNSRLVWYIIHASVCLFIVFLAPYAFIIYAFTVMFRVISKRQRPRLQNDNTRLRFQTKRNTDRDRKCIVVFAIMATFFVFCWLPYFTIMLIIYVKQYQSSPFPVSISNVFEVFAIVRYMTSITNPLLYTFFKRDFCLALKTLLGNFATPPERLRSLSLSLRRTHDMTQPVSLDNNLILLVSWNRVNANEIGLEASYTVSDEQV